MPDTPGTTDEAVSPMEAQNTGPERAGPAEEPLRREKPSEHAKGKEAEVERLKSGGEPSTRDDL